ncbi:Right handed beta helix region [Arenibacter palladensis]|uniref:Right handed beta helix region n=1 Tax=Arenibacter palladensis TaxID=237373 RepID=A0A1M4XZW9_9FLAO|nr:hypothetical protein [Arenibacter palladensis]SHE99041.1 Right handed beta helix region [Arenibacter palladensis]
MKKLFFYLCFLFLILSCSKIQPVETNQTDGADTPSLSCDCEQLYGGSSKPKVINIDGGNDSINALAINNKVSDFEIAHLQIENVELGIHILNKPGCATSSQFPEWEMKNIIIHNNLTQNIGNEGLYIGYSKFLQPVALNCDGSSISRFCPVIKNIHIYNNIVENCGWDGLQVSYATGGAKIFNNVINATGLKNKPTQRAGIVVGGGTRGDVYVLYLAMALMFLG